MNDLEKILDGKTPTELKELVDNFSYKNLGHTRVDISRKQRTGVGEVIFGASKTPEQILEIAKTILEHNGEVLITRLKDEAISLLESHFKTIESCKIGRIASIRLGEKKALKHKIAIVTAGTSDMPVAQEAKFTAEFLGNSVDCFYDCGVAGIHRILSQIDEIAKADVVIAIAGMEGALPTVLAGLLKCPVIAVPTSVGYGAAFEGLSALLTMVNSCANGVSIVNIDNGYGAAYNAHLICKAKA